MTQEASFSAPASPDSAGAPTWIETTRSRSGGQCGWSLGLLARSPVPSRAGQITRHPSPRAGARRTGARPTATSGSPSIGSHREPTAMPPGNSHRKTRLADRLCQDQNWTIWVPSPSRPTVVAAANLRRYMSPHGLRAPRACSPCVATGTHASDERLWADRDGRQHISPAELSFAQRHPQSASAPSYPGIRGGDEPRFCALEDDIAPDWR